MTEKRKKITAVVGTYRRGGTIDRVVDLVLEAAEEAGAETARIRLADRKIEFCRNCRACTQEPGEARGRCVIDDDTAAILDALEGSDAIILASPMNFGTVTALSKAFIERLICYAYWPWGAASPKMRVKKGRKRALLIGSSAAPAFLGKRSGGMVKLLESAARTLGARKSELLFVGFAAMKEGGGIWWPVKRKARRLGRKLARG